MRPKPLMATFTAASVVVLTAAACAWRWAGRTVSVEDAGERTIRNAGRSCRVQSGRDADATTHLDGLAALEAGGLTAELSLRGKEKMDDGVFHQSTRSSRVNPGRVGTVGSISATVPRG